MAVLYIAEFSNLALNGGAQVMQEGAAVENTVVIGAGSLQSAVFAENTSVVRLHTDAICSVAFGANPTATTSKMRMAANQTEYFGVRPGHRVAVIANT